MTPEDYALIFAENIARANAETFCASHGIPVNAIEKTETGYKFSIEFNYMEEKKEPWRPNMAQINALSAAIKQIDKGNADVLRGLYNKLMNL